MGVLLLAEINDGALAMDATAKAVTAASALGNVTLLCTGATCADAAAEAATIQGVDAKEFLAQVDALSSSIDPFGTVEGAQPRGRYDRAESTAWSSELMARGVLTNLASGPLKASTRVLWQGSSR